MNVSWTRAWPFLFVHFCPPQTSLHHFLYSATHNRTPLPVTVTPSTFRRLWCAVLYYTPAIYLLCYYNIYFTIRVPPDTVCARLYSLVVFILLYVIILLSSSFSFLFFRIPRLTNCRLYVTPRFNKRNIYRGDFFYATLVLYYIIMIYVRGPESVPKFGPCN